jgi:hypothetical protein
VFGRGITVEVIGVVRDKHGDRAETVVGSIPGCAFAPEISTEYTDQRAQVVSADALYVPPTDVVITAQSKVRFDGQVWQVQGEVRWWRHPMTGWSPGGVIHLRRTTG